MKTKEELNALKEEVKNLNKKLAELNEEELALVIGGTGDGCLALLEGYYCPNESCYRYGMPADTKRGCGCPSCGECLTYGILPLQCQ